MTDLMAVSGKAGRMLVNLLGKSWRIVYVRPRTGRSGAKRSRPTLFAFWHGRQLPMLYTHRYEDVSVLVSRNRDGQYVTNILEKMGFSTIRGSTSRGGLRALRETSVFLSSGGDVAITPDGPRGPAEKPADGVAVISSFGKKPVVAMGTSAWPRIRFRSWDKFILPLPFSLISIVEGRPLWPWNRMEESMEFFMSKLKAEMRRVSYLSDFNTDPLARFQAGIFSLVGRILKPAVKLSLLFRSPQERRERTGCIDTRYDHPVWFHGSSLGEIKGLLPLIRKTLYNDLPVHVTCFTPQGRELLKKENLPSCFLPLDIPSWTRKFLKKIQPRLLVIAETELWPNLLREAARKSIPVIMANARLDPAKIKGYRYFSRFISLMLSSFVRILARTREDADRFISLGVDERCVKVAGDTKAASPPDLPEAYWRNRLPENMPVLVAGSTRPGEEVDVVLAAGSSGMFPVVAPRHLERVQEVVKLLIAEGLTVSLWSEEKQVSPEETDCLILDTHGMLTAFYALADVAFVGGTMVPIGGHNVLEPLQHGIPLVVGKYYENHRDVVNKAVAAGFGVICRNRLDMERAFTKLMTEKHDTGIIKKLGSGDSERAVNSFLEALDIAAVTDRKGI